jgi:hypothetical protein
VRLFGSPEIAAAVAIVVVVVFNGIDLNDVGD